jgi:hypothetical protein
MSRSKFDIDYNNWLRKVEVTEADSVWEEVQYELDFTDTWKSISKELDRVAPVSSGLLQGSLIKTAVIATTMLFLLFVPTKRLENPGVREDIIVFSNEPLAGNNEPLADNMDASPLDDIAEVQSIAQYDSSPEMGTKTIQTDVPVKKSIAETTGKTAIEKQPVNITAIDSPAEKYGTGIAADIPQPALVFNSINNRKFISDINRGSVVNGSSLPFSFAPESDNSSGVRSALKLMDLGIIYSFKNTWLINYETLNGLNPEKLGNTLPTFHKDIGVSSTLLLRERHFIGLDFMIKSEAGQNYQQYINASYLRRNIQLNYSKLQGYYIWNRGRIPGQLLTGVYLARLNSGEERQGDEIITIRDNYSNYDYGLMVGYQLSIFLHNKIIVRPGFRLNYNLVNIFRGDELTPGYLKDTRNVAAGFKISLSYRFSN